MLKNNKKIIYSLIITFWFLLGSLTYALSFKELINNLSNRILLNIVALGFVITIVFFIWAIFVFVMSAGDPRARAENGNRIVFAIFAIFIVATIWGILGFLQKSFGVESTSTNKSLRIHID